MEDLFASEVRKNGLHTRGRSALRLDGLESRRWSESFARAIRFIF